MMFSGNAVSKLLCTVVLSLLLSLSCLSLEYTSLKAGSSLSVENMNDVLHSPNDAFSAGFLSVGDNAYCFSVWFNNARNSSDLAVVWMANRDFPVNGKRSELLLLKTANLILLDAGKSIIWATNTSSDSFAQLFLEDTGNLVLRDLKSVVLWQSFDFPTDTLLPYQNLTRFTQLISSRRQGSYSSGYYKMFFDNGNLLRLLYDGPNVSSIYWPYPWLLSRDAGRNADNNTRIAFFDPLGNFSSSDSFSFITSDYGRVLQRRLKLDFDGNARMYSRQHKQDDWYVSWEVKLQPCQIHGMCGPNTTCGYDPHTGGNCACLPGYKRLDAMDWSYGCEPDFQLSCSANDSRFLRIKNLDFYGYDYGSFYNYTYKECKSMCLQLCNCKGFQLSFTSGSNGAFTCYPKTLLLNGYNSPNFEGSFYLRLPKNGFISNAETFQRQVGSSISCSIPSQVQLDRTYTKSPENATVKFVLWFASGMGCFELMMILFTWCFFIRNRQKSQRDSQGNMYVATGFRKFSYQELKEATKSFSEEIGRGAGATVYIGVLSDQRVAAIKYLNGAAQGEQEFLAEVNVIGRLNHMNLIEMWGYCLKGKRRLLVYEYMKLGSLADNLQSKALNWRKRYDIALGIARGLAYLHEECLEWILHCDVKPQNILLDTDYQPKIADFGLSKLLKRNDIDASDFSRIRGTRGYMAPEWVYNAPITSKVDVYSYGIVVLEMLTGKNPAMGIQCNGNGEDAKNMRLVSWVREIKLCGSSTGTQWLEQIVDSSVEGDFDRMKMEILAETALDCVNEDRDARPSMSQVVKILES